MTAADAIELYAELQALGINVWIDGGWGVDALLGAQTRPHKDLDIAIEEKDLSRLTAALKARGYREVIRHSQWNFELSDDRGRQVDVHSFVLAPDGNVERESCTRPDPSPGREPFAATPCDVFRRSGW